MGPYQSPQLAELLLKAKSDAYQTTDGGTHD
jgi:hypothetical protein